MRRAKEFHSIELRIYYMSLLYVNCLDATLMTRACDCDVYFMNMPKFTCRNKFINVCSFFSQGLGHNDCLTLGFA